MYSLPDDYYLVPDRIRVPSEVATELQLNPVAVVAEPLGGHRNVPVAVLEEAGKNFMELLDSQSLHMGAPVTGDKTDVGVIKRYTVYILSTYPRSIIQP
jgi:hypothetical protein